MSDRKTIRIQAPDFGEPEGDTKHAALIVLKGAELGRDFRLRKTPMNIGRSSDAEIRVPDDRASRKHARIDYRGEAWGEDVTFFVTDLESTNGTFVNSERIQSTQLHDGDKIQVGDTILKFVVLDAIEARFHAEIRDRITYDRLTGLLTKESLYLALDRELERCLRYDLPLSVLMMDLDQFKTVNDTHGHQMGSHVLSEVGEILRRDLRNQDVVARYGGEEFVAYLSETDTEGAKIAAERIRRGIESHAFTLDDVTIGVTISLGVATAPGHGSSIKELVGAADEALYRAKETGRNRTCMA